VITEDTAQLFARRLDDLERELQALRRRAHGLGPWISTKQAAADLGKSRKAFWMWCQRHGIVIQNGFVTRADLDRAIRRKRA
jgi:hypothetical protein